MKTKLTLIHVFKIELSPEEAKAIEVDLSILLAGEHQKYPQLTEMKMGLAALIHQHKKETE